MHVALGGNALYPIIGRWGNGGGSADEIGINVNGGAIDSGAIPHIDIGCDFFAGNGCSNWYRHSRWECCHNVTLAIGASAGIGIADGVERDIKITL